MKIKKTILCVLNLVIILIGTWLIGTGFTKNSSVFINDYSISNDGSIMKIDVGVGSSVGFIRKVNVHKQEDGKIYLDFISAFGGINGSIGAKSKFEIPIDKDCQEIAIYRSNNDYQTVLEKDGDSVEWIRVK